ncbi:MAG: hypothetical protein IT430_03830 [Phycisphaerales bacterium]|nr:hypothetical protein [Phycisphaerales bacterium]
MNPPTADTLFAQAESAIVSIFVRTKDLVHRIDHLIARIADKPADAPASWYWPATDHTGRHADPVRLAEMNAPTAPAIDRNCAKVIEYVLLLREAFDLADAAVEAVGPLITTNNGVTNETWTVTTKGAINRIRLAIVEGQADRKPPTCLPIPSNHDAIESAPNGLETQLHPLRIERERFAKRVACAEPVVRHSTAAVIFSTTPHLWQRIQVLLELICLECATDHELPLDRIGQLGTDGLTVVARDVDQRIPCGLLDGGGPQTTACMDNCNQLKTLFGSLSRASRVGLTPEARSRLTSQAAELADWIEGTLRPYYPEQWVETPALRLALRPAPMVVAEVYTSLLELADAAWRIEYVANERSVPLDRLRQALQMLPDAPSDELTSAITRVESIAESGCVPGSRLGFPGIQDDQTRDDCAALVAWWRRLTTEKTTSPAQPRRSARVEMPPSLVLRGRDQGPIVCDVEKPILGEKSYNVIDCLIAAGARGLVGRTLSTRSGSGDAVNILKRLSKVDPDWKRVIVLPGRTGRGYRVLGGRHEAPPNP